MIVSIYLKEFLTIRKISKVYLLSKQLMVAYRAIAEFNIKKKAYKFPSLTSPTIHEDFMVDLVEA